MVRAMPTDPQPALAPVERQLVIDALLTYGLSLAALIRSERFQGQPEQRAKLFAVLIRTTALIRRLGGQVPAEMRLDGIDTGAPPIH